MNNKVELLGYYGSDEVIACSAWTSTSRNLTDEKRARVGRLIDMLWGEGHETPFEKGMVHFLVDTDIASHIHLLKHRISSLNAESARYKELKEDNFYVPEDWGSAWRNNLISFNRNANRMYHQCIEDLVESGMDRKRAKESARFFKPYSSQITADVMFNWRSFVHFLNLRNKPDAQLEIREIAATMLQQVKNIDGNPFKLTLEAFGL